MTTKPPPHPMQPVIDDGSGVIRFRCNEIVDALVEHGRKTGFDLNHIASMVQIGRFTVEDEQQLAQLIGYSVCGYHELPYVDDEHAAAASILAKRIDPRAGGCRDEGCGIHGGPLFVKPKRKASKKRRAKQ